jgi:carbon-monoxide dehydrogenase catalytic subunit
MTKRGKHMRKRSALGLDKGKERVLVDMAARREMSAAA